MTESMIERVARKLCEQDGGDPNAIRVGEGMADGRTWSAWEAYASQARQLIAVMRDPTGAMLTAATNEDDCYEDAPAGIHWYAMIDAALAE